MDNFVFKPPSTTSPSSSTNPGNNSVGVLDQNSQFSIFDPTVQNYHKQQHLTAVPPDHHHRQAMRFPFAYSSQDTFPSWFGSVLPNKGQQNVVLSKEKERRETDAWATKAARNKRRMARQRSLTLSRANVVMSSGSVEGHNVSAADDHVYVKNGDYNLNRNSYTFFTPDKKHRLMAVLKKQLRSSDVGSLGRIVLPKREAEENLPVLSDKEGIMVVIRDVYSYEQWLLKFKYWSNNKSRMYVLENTGEFVRQNGLEIGNYITLYEDECKNLYVSTKKAKKPVGEQSYEQHKTGVDEEMKELEEASLAVLGQLNHEMVDQRESSSYMTTTIPGCSSTDHSTCTTDHLLPIAAMEISSSMSPGRMKTDGVVDDDNDYNQLQINFEEYCCGGLDTLPEVTRFKYCPLFDHLNDDKTWPLDPI